MTAEAQDQSRRKLKMAADAAQWVSISAPLTGVIAGIVAFGEGVPAAGLALIAGSALCSAIGVLLACWAKVWLGERGPVGQPAD